MAESTTYPHEDFIVDNKINAAELPEKTNKLIEKFKAETDEDKKDALDLQLCGQVEDFVEARDKAAKAEKVKEKVAAHKEKKKLDVSKAATATGDDGKKKEEKPKDEPGLIKRMFVKG